MCQVAEHLTLAVGKQDSVTSKAIRDHTHGRALAVANRGDHVEKLIRPGTLTDICPCPGRERVIDGDPILSSRKHNDAVSEVSEKPHGLRAVDPTRQTKVHHDDITDGPPVDEILHPFGDDRECKVRSRLNRRPKPVRNDPVILDEPDVQHAGTSIRTLVPCPGDDETSTEPPTSLMRSMMLD